ncbi:VMA21-like domain-containing protein [Ditylenchus destructor]|uniref:VMA21-like domain-containing protein n=1 Tax=Ditylenchus destructor TaxID=166010 RepID=A0AAD4RBV6_9BILA|nr:VMA21-like domain-containing protein [Ditylenchus destructor]
MDELVHNFRDTGVQGAIKGLITYSLLILAVPLGSMFLLKMFFFEGLLGYSDKDSMTYSAIVAVILVHVVLILWIRKAFSGEPDKAEKAD